MSRCVIDRWCEYVSVIKARPTAELIFSQFRNKSTPVMVYTVKSIKFALKCIIIVMAISSALYDPRDLLLKVTELGEATMKHRNKILSQDKVKPCAQLF